MTTRSNIFTLLALVVATTVATGVAHAQGCVAAHTNQRTMDELVVTDEGGGHDKLSLHNLTVNIGYRVFNSNKYFVGTNQIARSNAVENHQNIFDIGLEYRMSPRWSLIADVPVYNGTRNQIYPPSGVFQVSGLGDMTLGAQAWIFRPPTESHGNVAVSLALKVPTGIDNATGSGLYHGTVIKATADQSLQPGDGAWGFVVGAQGFKSLWHRADAYGQGQYLFNPEDTNGVPTFRSQPGQSVMSVTDQYLMRAGVSQGVPRLRNLAFSLGIRSEGVPVRDLIGNSDGFRRPGSILSLDPGVMLSLRHTVFSVNGPWAVRRNRPPSVPEIQNNTTNGDAFFADYTVIASISHHF
ncbi:MAG: hypothetical protein KGK08_07325 [Acidobacteriota bacterium]|nr:hypothetical protein [Acidobacteriota bacterium]